MRVFLQPAGSPDAREHYNDTIENPVSKSVLQRHLSDSELAELQTLHDAEDICTWGITPGQRGDGATIWAALERGSVALFARQKHYISSGTITFKVHNAGLARELWGEDEQGQTWEYVYFLDEVQRRDIPYEALNEAAGYSLNFNLPGRIYLSEGQSDRVLAAFDLESVVHQPEVTEAEYEEAVRSHVLDPEEPLDAVSRVTRRKEQPFLRRQLFGNSRVGRCAFCGKELPVSMLVTAHIKRRSECSTEERLDHKNIVMALCKLGCDVVFEEGFATVVDGHVSTSKSEVPSGLQAFLATIDGRPCPAWSSGTEVYFQWHRDHRFRAET